MILRQLLAAERVLVPLPAATLAEAVERLLAACVTSGAVREPERLRADVQGTHAADAVTAFPGAFLPHYRTDAVDRLVAALGVTPEPVVGAGRGGRRARLVLLLLAPPRDATRYLQAVAACAHAAAAEDWLEGELMRRAALIREAVIEDPRKPFTVDDFDAQVAFLQEFARRRPGIVLAEVQQANEPAPVEGVPTPGAEEPVVLTRKGAAGAASPRITTTGTPHK